MYLKTSDWIAPGVSKEEPQQQSQVSSVQVLLGGILLPFGKIGVSSPSFETWDNNVYLFKCVTTNFGDCTTCLSWTNKPLLSIEWSLHTRRGAGMFVSTAYKHSLVQASCVTRRQKCILPGLCQPSQANNTTYHLIRRQQTPCLYVCLCVLPSSTPAPWSPPTSHQRQIFSLCRAGSSSGPEQPVLLQMLDGFIYACGINSSFSPQDT